MPLAFNLVHINYMFIQDKHYLIAINDKYEDSTSANIYGFKLGSQPDFWYFTLCLFIFESFIFDFDLG